MLRLERCAPRAQRRRRDCVVVHGEVELGGGKLCRSLSLAARCRLVGSAGDGRLHGLANFEQTTGSRLHTVAFPLPLLDPRRPVVVAHSPDAAALRVVACMLRGTRNASRARRAGHTVDSLDKRGRILRLACDEARSCRRSAAIKSRLVAVLAAACVLLLRGGDLVGDELTRWHRQPRHVGTAHRRHGWAHTAC